MKPSNALKQNREAIRRVVARHHTGNARVFGSVLRGEDSNESDLDLLVDTTRETTLMDLGAIRIELKKLLGVEVDVLTPGGLPDSFRDKVLREARSV